MYLKSYDDTAMVNIKHKFEGWSASGMSGLYDEQELFKNVETSQSICLINKVKQEEALNDILKCRHK